MATGGVKRLQRSFYRINIFRPYLKKIDSKCIKIYCNNSEKIENRRQSAFYIK